MMEQQTRPLGERRAFGPFALSPGERLLTRDGEAVEIGGRSLDLLIVLTDQPGRVLSKRDLLKQVWSDVVVEDGSLRFHMAGLRKLLGDGRDGARYISTQIGVGYAFVAGVERQGGHAVVVEQPAVLNLPPRLPLIGRVRDVALLQERVPHTPLFAIVGPGGAGKTSLAIEVGHVLSEAFAGQIAFVDLSMLENAALVPAMIAGAMGIAVQGEDPLAVILGHLRDRPFLLLLDNCEHVIEQVAHLVERIVEHAPQARILATSREPLRVRGEHVHRLDALAYPEDASDLTLEEILAFPAVQLLCERACAADTALTIDVEAARLIAQMCHRLDGMALPIELAAVRVASHGIHATARQLGERFSLGWAGRRTAQPRQQTLQAMLDWSYDLLSPDERTVLERLSVFVGPFSVDAALDVVADADLGSDAVAAALDDLTARSMLSPDRARGTGTYRLLEMTRAYARQKLRAREGDAFNRAARRHAGFFLAELEAIAAQDEDTLDPRPLRQQLGNIRSALDWAFGPDGDRRTGIRLAAAGAPIFLHLSHLVECRTWCARALADMDESQRGTAIEMDVQGALGIALMFTRGNGAEAGDALTRALNVATALDDGWNQLRMLARLHVFHERIGGYAFAGELADRAVAVADTLGDAEARGIACSLSGISHYLAGEQRRARANLDTAFAQSAITGRTLHYGFDHRNRTAIALARVLWLTGHAEQAGTLARETVAVAARGDNAVTLCVALIWSLVIHLWIGDLEVAEDTLATLTTCAQVNALGPYTVAASGFRGQIAMLRRDDEGALEAISQSLIQLRATRYEPLITLFSVALAQGLLAAGQRDEASAVIDAAITRCHAIGEGFAMPDLLGVKARIALNNAPAEATAILQQARAICREQGAPGWGTRFPALPVQAGIKG
jgi:predicted ATPase/DNA-binding winged helix-turn-helix (wHTH) protein